MDEDAARYVKLAVALGERDADSIDFYTGPADFVADLRRSPPALLAIRRDAEALFAHVSREASRDSVAAVRAKEIAGNLAAIVARVNLLTGKIGRAHV